MRSHVNTYLSSKQCLDRTAQTLSSFIPRSISNYAQIMPFTHGSNAPPQKIQKWHHVLQFPRSVQQASTPPRSFSTSSSPAVSRCRHRNSKKHVLVQCRNKDHGLQFSAWKWKLGFRLLSWKGNFWSFSASCLNTKLIPFFFLFFCSGTVLIIYLYS